MIPWQHGGGGGTCGANMHLCELPSTTQQKLNKEIDSQVSIGREFGWHIPITSKHEIQLRFEKDLKSLTTDQMHPSKGKGCYCLARVIPTHVTSILLVL